MRPVIFSIADGNSTFFVESPDRKFRSSLVHNLLFEERIIIPDSFFFVSPQLRDHILNSDEQSLLEVAVSKRLIVPAFRSRSYASYRRLLQGLQESGICGLLRDTAELIAGRLDHASNDNPDPVEWPQGVGRAYEALVREYYASEEFRSGPLTKLNERAKAIWEDTYDLRCEFVEQAGDTTKKIDAQGGLRRGELINSIGRHLGSNKTLNTWGELIDLAATNPKLTPEAVEHLARWANELYLVNQADCLDARRNIPSFDARTSLVPSGTLTQSSLGEVATIDEIVVLPTVEQLLRVSPRQLLDIREAQGAAYLGAVKAWSLCPNEENARRVQTSLRKYADHICQLAPLRVTSRLRAILGAPRTRVEHLTRTGLLSLFALAAADPIVAGMGAVPGALWAVYVCWPTQEKTEIHLDASKSQAGLRVEFNSGGNPTTKGC